MSADNTEASRNRTGLQEHKKARRNKSHIDSDFVDTMLTLQRDGQLSEQAILGIILDMVAGGTDTNATGSEWAMLELVRKPGQ
jgi:cytochrome P450